MIISPFQNELKSIKTLNLEHIKQGDYIGDSEHGKIRIAYDTLKKQYFALKCINKGEMISSQQVDHVYNEVTILSKISHPFIYKFKGMGETNQFLYLATELNNGGTLYDYLNEKGRLSVPEVRFYLALVILALEYLHQRQIISRGVRPENFSIADNGYIRLNNLSHAKAFKKKKKRQWTYTVCGTPEYAAPEVILKKGTRMKVDTYAVGILMYELLIGHTPYYHDNPMQMFKNILLGKKAYDWNETKLPQDAILLMKSLLQVDPSKRPSNMRNFKFFEDVLWQELITEPKVRQVYIPAIQNPANAYLFTAVEHPTEKTKQIEKSLFENYV